MTTTQYQQVMTHIILLAPKAETQDEALEQLFQKADKLYEGIPGLVAVAAGENHSIGHRGFTHGVIMHFSNEDQLRDAFQHPTYQGLREGIARLCEQLITFDLPESLPFSVASAALEPLKPAVPETPVITKQPKQSRRKKPTIAEMLSSPVTESPSRERVRRLNRRRVEQIDPRLVKIMVDQLDVEEKEVTLYASLVLDLNADSLDLVELIMSVEEVFRIQISDEDAERLTTVGEIQEYLMERNIV